MVADAESLERDEPLRDVLAPHQDARGSFSGYEANALFYNPDGSFEGLVSAGYVLGLDQKHDGRAVAPVDIDGDGDLDLALLSLQGLTLLENTAAPRHFARVRLSGRGGASAAVGTLVELLAGGVTHRDFVKTTEGFQTQVPADLHFGLGDVDTVDEISVRWPSGRIERWRDLPVDRLLHLREGTDGVDVTDVPRWPDSTRPQPLPAPSPTIDVERLDGGRTPLGGGRPLVVNFWAPWCAPCKVELPELVRVSGRYAGAVDFAGVSVELEDLESVRASIDAFDIPYAQFLADDAVMERFFGAEDAAALPSTYVFDGQGALRRVFRGAVTGAELESLLTSFEEEGLFTADLTLLALRAMRAGELDRAIELYAQVSALEPDNAEPLYETGVAWLRLDNLVAARGAFEAAVGRNPSHAAAHYNLGLARLRTGLPSAAVENFQAAVALVGDEFNVLLQLGVAAADSGQLDLALDALTRAASIQTDAVEPLMIRARVHRARNAGAAAAADYRRVLRLRPDHALARQELDALPPR